MLRRLSIAFTQQKAGKTSENLLNEILQMKFCIEQKPLLKRYINEFIKVTKQNGNYI